MPEVTFRRLRDPEDRALVTDFYRRAADYIRLETGAAPDENTTEAFFTGSVQGHDCAGDLREGLFLGGRLEGIAELAFDLPIPGRATLTLMVLAEDSRGKGLGTAWLERMAQAALDAGASQLWLSVLDSNPRAQAFWKRHGFALIPSQIYRSPRHRALPGTDAPEPPTRHQMMRSLL